MKKSYSYLKVEQLIYCEGTHDANVDNFIDDFLDLLDKYNWQCGGSFQSLTDEEADEHVSG